MMKSYYMGMGILSFFFCAKQNNSIRSNKKLDR